MNKETNIKEIVSKYLQDKCSREELEAALKLFDDPYFNLALRPALYEQWNKTEKGAQKEMNEWESTSILDEIHDRIHFEKENKKRKKRILKLIGAVSKIAAILIIGLFLGLSIQRLQKSEPFYYTSIAPKGSISQIILPDNTMVYLNSGSEIKYTVNNTSGQREVYLNGEAWFDVTKNEKNPFVVNTPFYSVKALGTRFNVKAYKTDETIATTLEEGRIEVLSGGNNKFSGNKLLKPGQQFIYNQSTGTVKTKNVSPRLFTSWKENKLIFINMNLKQLIVLLERKYGVDIEVADNIILDYHYDGTIKNETILEVLDLLKETLPISYKIIGQKVIIQKK
jgi:ferric-dicitrate binding protein FerR (iron transport regulator)